MTRQETGSSVTATLGAHEDGATWKCRGCGRTMGELFRHRVHLRPRGGHTYYSRYPLTAICSNCGEANTIKNFPPR